MFYIWLLQIMSKKIPSWTSSSDILHINRVIFTNDKVCMTYKPDFIKSALEYPYTSDSVIMQP